MTAMLKPAAVLRLLLVSITLLVTAHVGMLMTRYGLSARYLVGMIALFDMNGEQNVPALLSTLLLLSCAGPPACSPPPCSQLWLRVLSYSIRARARYS
jgi:hypothetical protein